MARVAALLCTLTGAAALAAPVTRAPLEAPLLDAPVYSLATLNGDGSSNMNIVTYASPVGIRPERRWTLSLYRGTRSHANFAARRRGVLQLLREAHAPATHALGGVSAAKDDAVDKAAACEALGLGWETCGDWDERVLPGCAVYLRLEAVDAPVDCGDHEVFTCRVAGGFGDGGDHLTTGELRRLGLITEKGAAAEPAAAFAAEPAAASAAASAAAFAGEPAADTAGPPPWRRAAAAAAFAAAVAGGAPPVAFGAAPLQLGECRRETNALYSTRTCLKYGRDKDGRLRSCLPSENCVSTSAVKSPAQFSPPWAYTPTTSDAKVAFSELVAAVRATPGLSVETVDDASLYLRATADTVVKGGRAVDKDDVEFVVDEKKSFVFYRSASRESIFFFPAQNLYSVPLGDDGTNQARLESIRTKLGWESMGARSEDVDDNPASYQPLRR